MIPKIDVSRCKAPFFPWLLKVGVKLPNFGEARAWADLLALLPKYLRQLISQYRQNRGNGDSKREALNLALVMTLSDLAHRWQMVKSEKRAYRTPYLVERLPDRMLGPAIPYAERQKKPINVVWPDGEETTRGKLPPPGRKLSFARVRG